MDCQQNLEMSIRTRVTMPRPVPRPQNLPIGDYVDLLVNDFRTGCGLVFVSPADFEEWNSRWPLKKREVMRAALFQPPRYLKMAFTKAEFVKPGDPRNIVCSSPTVLARLGPITTGFDHALKRHPAAIKGYNYAYRAEKMSALRKHAHFMTSDYSRFDRTVSSELLQIELEVYKALCPELQAEPWLLDILRVREIRANSWRGVSYRAEPMRGTGDANTALGNWLLNRLVWLLVQRKYPCTVFIEGDDSIAGYDAPVQDFEAYFKEICAHLGFNPRCWSSDRVDDIPFCGRYLTATGPPRTVPSLIGYLTKWHVSKRTVYQREDADALLRFKTMSYLAMEPTTPIVAAIARFFLRVLPDAVLPDPVYLQVLKDNNYCLDSAEPSEEERLLVQRLSGITPDQQIWAENYFDSLQEMPDSFPDLLDFVSPDTSKVEVCPLPPPWFDLPKPRRKKHAFTTKSRSPQAS